MTIPTYNADDRAERLAAYQDIAQRIYEAKLAGENVNALLTELLALDPKSPPFYGWRKERGKWIASSQR